MNDCVKLFLEAENKIERNLEEIHVKASENIVKCQPTNEKYNSKRKDSF